MLQLAPILAPFIIVTLGPMVVPAPISTSAAMEVKGPTLTWSPILALGCTSESL